MTLTLIPCELWSRRTHVQQQLVGSKDRVERNRWTKAIALPPMLLRWVMNVLLMYVQGVYVTYIYEGGPAHHCGLHVHDKILQV